MPLPPPPATRQMNLDEIITLTITNKGVVLVKDVLGVSTYCHRVASRVSQT